MITQHGPIHADTREIPLGEVLVNTQRGLSSFYKEEGDTLVRLIKAKDIDERGILIASSVDEVKIKKTDSLKKATVSTGDVIITLKGSTFKAATVEKHAEGFVISANLISMTCNEQILPEFLTGYLNSSIGQNLLKKNAGGSVIMSLNMDFLKNLLIPVPPVIKQKGIVEFAKMVQEYTDLLDKEKDLLIKISDTIFSMNYSNSDTHISQNTGRNRKIREYHKNSGEV